MRQLLSDAIDDYMAHRRSTGVSKGTIANDGVQLRRLLGAAGNIYCHNITERHVTRHFEEAAKTRSPASMGQDFACLSKFFQWARATHRMSRESDPMYGRRTPKVVKRERSRLHVSAFPALLDAAGRRDPRDRIAVALVLYTLMRDREVGLLRVADVDLAAGYIHVRIFKSGLEDRMPICSELDRELRTWLDHYSATTPVLPSDFLVPSRIVTPKKRPDGKYLSQTTVRYRAQSPVGQLHTVVGPALDDIGFATMDAKGAKLREGAHTLRRSGARALFDALVATGYDHALRIVQSMLHHASVSTTEAYIGITADRRSRDELLRGKSMYRLPEVVSLEDRRGNQDNHRLVV